VAQQQQRAAQSEREAGSRCSQSGGLCLSVQLLLIASMAKGQRKKKARRAAAAAAEAAVAETTKSPATAAPAAAAAGLDASNAMAAVQRQQASHIVQTAEQDVVATDIATATATATAHPATKKRSRDGKPHKSKKAKSKRRRKSVDTDDNAAGVNAIETATRRLGDSSILAPPSSYPFSVDAADHAETPAEAYSDVAPILHSLASRLGKTSADLQIYDPFYCVRAHHSP
jgi:Flp pilus assembly protein TadG